MATESRNVISTFSLAGLNSAADVLPSPFASPLSITGIAMTAAGVLAGGVAVSAIDAVRRDH
jgi:hypothetical protein